METPYIPQEAPNRIDIAKQYVNYLRSLYSRRIIDSKEALQDKKALYDVLFCLIVAGEAVKPHVVPKQTKKTSTYTHFHELYLLRDRIVKHYPIFNKSDRASHFKYGEFLTQCFLLLKQKNGLAAIQRVLQQPSIADKIRPSTLIPGITNILHDFPKRTGPTARIDVLKEELDTFQTIAGNFRFDTVYSYDSATYHSLLMSFLIITDQIKACGLRDKIPFSAPEIKIINKAIRHRNIIFHECEFDRASTALKSFADLIPKLKTYLTDVDPRDLIRPTTYNATSHHLSVQVAPLPIPPQRAGTRPAPYYTPSGTMQPRGYGYAYGTTQTYSTPSYQLYLQQQAQQLQTPVYQAHPPTPSPYTNQYYTPPPYYPTRPYAATYSQQPATQHPQTSCFYPNPNSMFAGNVPASQTQHVTNDSKQTNPQDIKKQR